MKSQAKTAARIEQINTICAPSNQVDEVQQSLAALLSGIEHAMETGAPEFKAIAPGVVRENFAFLGKQLEREGILTQFEFIAFDLYKFRAWPKP